MSVLKTDVNRLHFTNYIGVGWSIFDRKTKQFKVMKQFKVTNDQDDCLGIVVLKPQCRKYVFAPASNCVFDKDCLDEIATFLFAETVRWRNSIQ